MIHTKASAEPYQYFLPPTADHVIKRPLNFGTFIPNVEENKPTSLQFKFFLVGFQGHAFIVVTPVEVSNMRHTSVALGACCLN